MSKSLKNKKDMLEINMQAKISYQKPSLDKEEGMDKVAPR
jgi:hypothetical protein